MTEVWTDWLRNPGDGRCPVPEWAEDFEVALHYSGRILSGSEQSAWYWKFNGHGGDITSYRYAIPASLYDLVKRFDEWPMVWPANIEGWARVDWLKAREDLGLDAGPSITQTHVSEPYRVISGTINGSTVNFTVKDDSGDDPVNHPRHYMLAPGMEAIDVIRAALTPEEYMGYLKGSILKYRLRAGRKGDAEQDIAKSDWYREEAIKQSEEW